MPQRKQSSRRKKDAPVGQVDVFGKVHGLDKLVDKPKVIEFEGLRVVHLMVRESDKEVPGYTDEALKLARQLAPETQSTAKPPWMRAEWQAKRRKQREATSY